MKIRNKGYERSEMKIRLYNGLNKAVMKFHFKLPNVSLIEHKCEENQYNRVFYLRDLSERFEKTSC